MNFPVDDQIQKAIAGAGLAVFSWGVWVTRKVFGQDKNHAVLCAKMDAIHDDIKELKEKGAE